MLYARALLLVRELHHLRRRVLVLINKSTFGKDDGELKTSLANASKFVEVHNKFMTLGGGHRGSRVLPCEGPWDSQHAARGGTEKAR